jgi:two-component system nitrogen regulation response regulator GlnG
MATAHGPSSRDRHPRRPCEAPIVLIFDRYCSLDRDALAALEECGFQVVTCRTSRNLLEEVVQHAPRVVVFELRPDSTEDLGVLQLVRRVAPDVPLILLAAEGSLDTQRLVQSLRPIYYAVCPIEPAELCEAVTAALSRPRPGRETSRPRASLR